jgi:multidrug transporter EmrE-like cation transporter
MSFQNVALLSLAEIVGDFGFKDFARTSSQAGFIQGSLGYVGVIFFLIKSLAQGNVLYVNGMWDGMSAIIESLAAFFILGERFDHPMQYIGLMIIIVGMAILRFYGISK